MRASGALTSTALYKLRSRIALGAARTYIEESNIMQGIKRVDRVIRRGIELTFVRYGVHSGNQTNKNRFP